MGDAKWPLFQMAAELMNVQLRVCQSNSFSSASVHSIPAFLLTVLLKGSKGGRSCKNEHKKLSAPYKGGGRRKR